MPKYSKSKGEKRAYRRKFPGFKNRKHMETVLAKLSTAQWKELQQHGRSHVDRKVFKEKVLPTSYDMVLNTEFPVEINRRLVEEDEKHNDHSVDFHKGGGLGTAVSSIFSAAWDMVGTIPGVGEAAHWLYDSVVSPNYGEDLQEMDQFNADALGEAYTDVDERAATLHGWLRVPKYDTSYLTVYLDPKTDEVHVAIRGSATAYDWLYHNVGIVTAQHPGRAETNQIREDLLEISEDYPNHDLTIATHSLSGAFLTDVFNLANAEDTRILQNYDHLNFYNPGGSPLADTSSIERILQDDRVKLFINRSDMINQTYNQMLQPDNEVVYGVSNTNPLAAHGWKQWATEDKEYDKAVDWGTDAFVSGADTKWDLGEETRSAFDSAGVDSPDT